MGFFRRNRNPQSGANSFSTGSSGQESAESDNLPTVNLTGDAGGGGGGHGHGGGGAAGRARRGTPATTRADWPSSASTAGAGSSTARRPGAPPA
ncbi:hypothetical protein THAOC_27141, partial [Thalassiosira oceanica]